MKPQLDTGENITSEKGSLTFAVKAAVMFAKWTNWRILQEKEVLGNRSYWMWYAQPVQSSMMQMHHPMNVHWESKGLDIIIITLCACVDKLERQETGGNSALRPLRGTQVGLQSSQEAGNMGCSLFLQQWGGESETWFHVHFMTMSWLDRGQIQPIRDPLRRPEEPPEEVD